MEDPKEEIKGPEYYANLFAKISEANAARLRNVLLDIFNEEQKKNLEENKYLENIKLHNKVEKLVNYKLLLPEEKELFSMIATVSYKSFIGAMQQLAKKFYVINLTGGGKNNVIPNNNAGREN